jgi:hypothetical protein
MTGTCPAPVCEVRFKPSCSSTAVREVERNGKQDPASGVRRRRAELLSQLDGLQLAIFFPLEAHTSTGDGGLVNRYSRSDDVGYGGHCGRFTSHT